MHLHLLFLWLYVPVFTAIDVILGYWQSRLFVSFNALVNKFKSNAVSSHYFKQVQDVS